jgi:hypothetical protein
VISHHARKPLATTLELDPDGETTQLIARPSTVGGAA